MGRAPCCDKMGLKRGPWTSEEDQILITFIHRNGHGNWRALPKQAGLLRCGKSCRLRWTNYLRPDIKRGNFSPEEEEAIINLHQLLGNRWSTIASRLPGRTDNEIKNVWNTHLKKRLLRMGIDPATHAVGSPASHSLISLYNSKYKDASLAPPFQTQPEASPDSPTTFLNLSDSIHDSQDLSSEIFSSVSSRDSETVTGADSGSRLDCIDSFEVEVDLGYDQKPQNIQDENPQTSILQNQDFADEERWFPRENQDASEISSSEITWDDFSSMDGTADTNPQPLIWNMDFQSYDDDNDYWLNILRQAASSPTL
ncbi:hypothetical protein KI387_010809 [Taxus chinensis]|uniref:Uncharacterized protein n=1 Tax=Taxus chinensis TaxID=29808 RepID=A0AA38FMI6_TAXCH|nr:hypothetical protein KI387_010809 [Taxus chinensis]